MKKLLLFLIAYFISSGSLIWSQTLNTRFRIQDAGYKMQANARVIKWSDSLRTFSLPDQKLIKSPFFEGVTYDPASNLLPIYFEKIRLDNISYQLSVISYQLKNPVYEPIARIPILEKATLNNEI